MENVVFNMARMHRHGSAFYDFLRLRKRFFVDQLGWDVPHDGEVEMDQYDNPTAWYSLVLQDGEVVGGARAQPGTAVWGEHTYMLRDVTLGRVTSIPSEIVAGAEGSPFLWECTRVVVGDRLATAADRARCLALIVEGIVDVAAGQGAAELMCISRLAFVRTLRQLGYDCERRGEAYTEPADGNQYAVMAMPARSAPRAAMLAAGVLPAAMPASMPARMPAGSLPRATHRAGPVPLHAPQVA